MRHIKGGETKKEERGQRERTVWREEGMGERWQTVMGNNKLGTMDDDSLV